jgi:hypothetical protein
MWDAIPSCSSPIGAWLLSPFPVGRAKALAFLSPWSVVQLALRVGGPQASRREILLLIQVIIAAVGVAIVAGNYSRMVQQSLPSGRGGGGATSPSCGRLSSSGRRAARWEQLES